MNDSPIRTLSQGLNGADAMVLDKQGRLYVANYDGGNVVVYQPGATSILKKVSKGIDHATLVAIDTKKGLFVGNYIETSTNVVAFANYNAQHSGRTIDDTTEIGGLQTDSMDNLYIAKTYSDNIAVYAHSGKAFVRSIRKGIKYPLALAIGSDGYLYVANCGKKACFSDQNGNNNGSVTAYDTTTGKLVRNLTNGIADPRALAFDSSGTLYVANSGPHAPGSVSIFPPGATEPSRSIVNGVDQPTSLQVDSAGDVYVANYAASTITIYAPNGSTPSITIPAALSNSSSSLRIGP